MSRETVTLYWVDWHGNVQSGPFHETKKQYVALPDDAHPRLFRTHFPKAADNDSGHAAGVKNYDLWFSEQAAIEAEIGNIEARIERLQATIDKEKRDLKKQEKRLLEIRKKQSRT